jgi:hypothetical protein
MIVSWLRPTAEQRHVPRQDDRKPIICIQPIKRPDTRLSLGAIHSVQARLIGLAERLAA